MASLATSLYHAKGVKQNLEMGPCVISGVLWSLVAITGVGPQATATSADAQREIRSKDFDTLIEKLGANYADWETKITPQTRATLDNLIAKQRTIAITAKDDAAFLAATEGVIGFFVDKHLSIFRVESPGTALTKPPQIAWIEASVRDRLKKTPRTPFEGIWQTPGGRYRLGILKEGNQNYTGAVLSSQATNWSPGMVKVKFRPTNRNALSGNWWMGDFTKVAVKGSLLAEGILVIDAAGGTVLTRVYPPVRDEQVKNAARSFPWPDIFYSKLSKDTAWIRIPSFNDSFGPKLIDLMKKHGSEIEKIENLIIDIRQNGGGSDYVYAPLTPLIYSRPIYGVGAQIKCSVDNIAGWETLLTNPEIPVSEKAGIRKRIDEMRANLGGYLTMQPSFSVDTLPKVMPFPKRVAVLVEGAGSTAEQFILEAMQSRKVTMFGKGPSAGVLDFANVRSFTLPSGKFAVGNPTSRSLRLPGFPVDPNGIAPDVVIPKNVKDEIQFVQRWLENPSLANR